MNALNSDAVGMGEVHSTCYSLSERVVNEKEILRI